MHIYISTKTSFQIEHGYIFISGYMPVEQIYNLFPAETEANNFLLFCMFCKVNTCF